VVWVVTTSEPEPELLEEGAEGVWIINDVVTVVPVAQEEEVVVIPESVLSVYQMLPCLLEGYGLDGNSYNTLGEWDWLHD
jgi:hypothetical protein